jgi:hypothetical protein
MNRRDILKYMMMATGAGFTGSLAQQVMAGAAPTATPSKALFDAATAKKVAVLAEMIIPKTDTPGAIEAGVPKFIEMMVSDWYNDRHILRQRIQETVFEMQTRAASAGAERRRNADADKGQAR